MQIVITVEHGKVRLQIDQDQPVEINQTVEPGKLPEAVLPKIETPGIGKAVPGIKTGPARLDHRNNARTDGREGCGYCRKRGEPCVRHGGEDSQNYKGKAKQRLESRSKPETPIILSKPQNPIEPVPNAGLKQTDITSSSGAFLDPWNCEMCRNAQDLCKLHEGLNAAGKKPLIYKHTEGALANVSNAS